MNEFLTNNVSYTKINGIFILKNDLSQKMYKLSIDESALFSEIISGRYIKSDDNIYHLAQQLIEIGVLGGGQ